MPAEAKEQLTVPKAPADSRPKLQWVRPAVDAAMTCVLLFQMLPGKTGNVAHELGGVAFFVLFAVHHGLNIGWFKRLCARGGARAALALASDVLLTVAVFGAALTGMFMARSVLAFMAVPSISHLVRPLHTCLSYAAFLLSAFHAGLHMRVLRAYVGARGSERPKWALAAELAALALGTWAFVRLGVAGKLAARPSFPDAVTPLAVQLGLHAALAAGAATLGMLADDTLRPHPGGHRAEKE